LESLDKLERTNATRTLNYFLRSTKKLARKKFRPYYLAKKKLPESNSELLVQIIQQRQTSKRLGKTVQRPMDEAFSRGFLRPLTA
jgi:hypothetical protein